MSGEDRRTPGEGFSLPYAVPGALSWTLIAGCALGLVFFPDALRIVVTVFVGYVMLRMLLITVLAVVAELRTRRWIARDWTEGEGDTGPAGFAPRDVRHVVLVPNYKEPLDVLERTLAGLEAQHKAQERLIVVLGMEERESGSREKGEALAARFADSFLRIMVTVHPADIPGELACKASNMTWAAREARGVLDELGIAVERATMSACDADSVFHPKYFAAISSLFAHDEHRWERFWQAPLLYYNNIWRVPMPLRYSTWFVHMAQMGELATPWYAPLPISTYTLSMKMSEQTDWWDPAVISEDWHVYLRCLFLNDWNVRHTAVYLPTTSDVVEGSNLRESLVNRYQQVLRHSWGAEDVGYMLSETVARRRFADPRTLGRVIQVTHDHFLRVAVWFVLVSAFILRTMPRRAWVDGHLLDAPVWHGPSALHYLLAIGAVCIATMIALELYRCPPPDRSPWLVVLEVATMWMLAPILGFLLGTMPALHAQTKLAAGIPLAWKVSPKRLAERIAET